MLVLNFKSHQLPQSQKAPLESLLGKPCIPVDCFIEVDYDKSWGEQVSNFILRRIRELNIVPGETVAIIPHGIDSVNAAIIRELIVAHEVNLRIVRIQRDSDKNWVVAEVI